MPEASENQDLGGTPPETTPEPRAAVEPEPSASTAVAAEVAPAAQVASDEGDETEQAGGEAAEAAGAAEGDASGTKRKRRRRKKRKGEGAPAEGEATAAGEAAPEPRRRRDAPPAPFARFFTGAHGGRKHGFAVGEVVAGRVKELANGTITVDLFGKAIAYADEFEPREAPPPREFLPDAPAVVEAEPSAAAAAAPDADAKPAADVTEGAAMASLAADVAQSVPEPAPEAAAEVVAEAVTPVDAAHAIGEEPALVDAHDAAGEGELDNDADSTSSGEVSAAGHGPLPPAPVVPESFARPEPPALGQVFRGRVGALAESGHIAIVNRDIERKAVLANLQRYRDERRRVQGLVFGFNRGGFDVLVEGIRAFCPASAMTLEELADPASLLGHKLEFLLPASQSVGKDIVVSRRSILERQLRKRAKELVRSLEPGQRIKGRVTQVREFGVFVDIGGIEGLVHQSELSFAHGVKPSDVAAVGDEVEVQVLRVGGGPEGGRRDRVERISLSMKALQADPWQAHADAVKEGSAQLGKVTRTTDFGAFIELAPQIEGLLHITELGRDLKHANQAVQEGEEIPVVIERMDRATRRISLSKLTRDEFEEYKTAVAAGEEPARNVRPGSRIKVKVTRVEGRGLVVRVAGALGKKARGYVPASELMGDRGDLRKGYPIGSELEVKVVGLDRDGGLRCSPKALQVDDERKAVKDYRREAAKQGFGTFGDLLRAKLGEADSK